MAAAAACICLGLGLPIWVGGHGAHRCVEVAACFAQEEVCNGPLHLYLRRDISRVDSLMSAFAMWQFLPLCERMFTGLYQCLALDG